MHKYATKILIISIDEIGIFVWYNVKHDIVFGKIEWNQTKCFGASNFEAQIPKLHSGMIIDAQIQVENNSMLPIAEGRNGH